MIDPRPIERRHHLSVFVRLCIGALIVALPAAIQLATRTP